MSTPTIRTMQDLLESLDRLGYSKATADRIRPRIRDCARVYNQPLNRIPADLGAFEARWGRGRVGAIAAGFKSHDHFVEWRRRVRAALARAAGAPSGTAELTPDWARLVELVEQNSGPGRRYGPHRAKGLAALGRRASAGGRAPAALDAASVEAVFDGVSGRERRTLRRGLDTLAALIADRRALGDIDALLPPAPPRRPGRGKAAPSRWRRGGPESTDRLWAEFDAFVARKRGRDAFGRPLPPEDSGFGATTARNYERSVAQAASLLERAGRLRPGDAPGLSEICSPAAIAAVIEQWQTRILEDELRSDASSLYRVVERLAHVAEFGGTLNKRELKRLREIREQVRRASPHRGRMSAPRLDWIQQFARSPAQQRAVHDLPETLMRRARPILADWELLRSQRRRKLRMHALSLGIAAVQAAILHRGSPVRAGNLNALRFRGSEAQLLFDGEASRLRISIPGRLVKNGVEVEAEADPDARPVLDWYLAEIRPRLIADHPFGHNLADSDYLFPSTRPDRPLDDTVFAGHFRTGAQAAGLDMTLHQARHVTAYLVLAEDPSALPLAAAILGTNARTVEAHYAWIDGVRAAAEGRRLLREARSRARRHCRGSLEHV